MTTTSPRLVAWENGTDLVIELPLDVEPAAVWAKLTDREEAGTWFAPFHVESAGGDEPDEDSESDSDADCAGDANPRITFDLGQTQLGGVILSSEVEDHVLIELDDFGVLGFQLLPLELTDGAATLLVFTQSAPDVESARLKAADFGPMWDTHLRLFARSFGLEVAEASEPELLERYADLELEDGRDAE